jgi:hypothetical protein
MPEGVVDEGAVADQQVVEAEEHNLVGRGKGSAEDNQHLQF